MEYNAKVIYEQEDCIALWKAFHYMKKPTRILVMIEKFSLRIVGSIFIFIGAIGIISILWRLIVDRDIVLDILGYDLIFIGIGVLFMSRSVSKGLGKTMWKKYEEKGLEFIFSFYSDHFVIQTHISEHNMKYAVIKSICEDRSRYFLFTANNQAYVIKKVRLGLDNSEQFGSFIAEKTGKSIIQIK